MQAEYVNHMGDDLMVVNSARVSFNKESELEPIMKISLVNLFSEEEQAYRPTNLELKVGEKLSDADTKLIRYLATHGHWTPFSHPQICLRISAPIFVARQLYKHKVGFTENEVSRRYVDDAPVFYCPDEWRGRPKNGAKQGSSEDTVETLIIRNDVECWTGDVTNEYLCFLDCARSLYNSMLDAGVAPEQARMVLPQSMYTEWYWTASLAAYARMYRQRSDPHAQMETQLLAKQIDAIIRPLFPVSWSVLVAPE